jgi:uncharacterized protein (DUF342 family)
MTTSREDIITREEQLDTLSNLTKDQIAMLINCEDRMSEIRKDGKITERTLRELTSVMRELDSLRELFYLRLFNSLKRGDILR